MVALFTTLVTGCSWFRYSSQHKPRPKPGSALRLTVIDSSLVVVGGPQGRLDEKVASVPDAAQAARTYRRRSLIAGIGSLVGGACLGVSTAIYLDGLRTDGSEYDAPLALGATAAGCAVLTVGSWLLGESARPYFYDAINIYNDRIDAAGDAAVPAGSR